MRTFAIVFLVAQLGSYVFSKGDHQNHVRIFNHDWPVGIHTNGDSPFLWFSYDNREYMIRDAATLRDIDMLFAGEQALEPQRRDLRARMRPLEREQRDLERERDRYEDRIERLDDEKQEAERRDLEGKIEGLERKLDGLEAQLDKLEQEEEALDQKEEVLEHEAEKQLEVLVGKAIRSGTATPR